MDKQIIKAQQETLKALSGQIDDFYLSGGTALSLFYFQHRLSVDLDFFTQSFNYQEVERIVEYLEKTLKKKMVLSGRMLEEKTAKMAVFNIQFSPSVILKVDFVEDVVKLVAKTKIVDGVRILSLEDIYLRKIYALSGMVRSSDAAGRGIFIGGRADAKDFYDIYCLSHTFKPLSEFVTQRRDRAMMEAVVRWFRTFDRMAMMDGVLELVTSKAIDYKAIERHFKAEVDRIVSYEIGAL